MLTFISDWMQVNALWNYLFRWRRVCLFKDVGYVIILCVCVYVCVCVFVLFVCSTECNKDCGFSFIKHTYHSSFYVVSQSSIIPHLVIQWSEHSSLSRGKNSAECLHLGRLLKNGEEGGAYIFFKHIFMHSKSYSFSIQAKLPLTKQYLPQYPKYLPQFLLQRTENGSSLYLISSPGMTKIQPRKPL